MKAQMISKSNRKEEIRMPFIWVSITLAGDLRNRRYCNVLSLWSG